MARLVTVVCLTLMSTALVQTTVSWPSRETLSEMGLGVKVDGIPRTMRVLLATNWNMRETEKYNSTQLKKEAQQTMNMAQKFWGAFNLRLVLVDADFWENVVKHMQEVDNYEFDLFYKISKGSGSGVAGWSRVCGWKPQTFNGKIQDGSFAIGMGNYGSKLLEGWIFSHEFAHTMGVGHHAGSSLKCNCTETGQDTGETFGGPCRQTSSPAPCSGQEAANKMPVVLKCLDHAVVKNPATTQIPICGNGHLEKGEECDCGPMRFCNDPKCDPYDCTWRKITTPATTPTSTTPATTSTSTTSAATPMTTTPATTLTSTTSATTSTSTTPATTSTSTTSATTPTSTTLATTSTSTTSAATPTSTTPATTSTSTTSATTPTSTTSTTTPTSTTPATTSTSTTSATTSTSTTSATTSTSTTSTTTPTSTTPATTSTSTTSATTSTSTTSATTPMSTTSAATPTSITSATTPTSTTPSSVPTATITA